MSLTGDLALPQNVVVEGRPAKLHPMGMVELAETQEYYQGSLRKVAILATDGLNDTHQMQTLQAVAETVSFLSISAKPLLDWLLTIQGIVAGLRVCLEFDDGKSVSKHELSRWIAKCGGIEEGPEIDRWLIDSGLRADPNDAELEAEDNSASLSENEDSDKSSSTEQSSDGAIESQLQSA